MKPIVIDVRSADEFKMGHFEGALNLTPEDLMNGAPQLDEVPKDSQIIVYCRSGARSNAAIHILQDLGFTNLVNGINQRNIEQMLNTA